MRTLHLTSPLEHGQDVVRMQQALIKHQYLKSNADGVYGPLSAQAAYRAKFWLGYPQPDQKAGPTLLAYLEGRKSPSDAMQKLAARRHAQRPVVPMRQKALNWLTGHIGDKEQPAGSNRIPWASEWYGIIGPWCAMAVTRAYVEAGSEGFKRGARYAYVPFIVQDCRAGRQGLALTTMPEPGDLVCFDWDGDHLADHIGLFVKWIDKARTQLETVEGNTAVGNDSNGGEVMRRNRQRSNVLIFGHCAR